ncbi:hypothetical protein T492DRAFT_1006124 [Pavlovales sp. CCMP2436]|nr:hypothetical protein T492DRAFT_1006124 [Pavlovales sp. CCMP2436]
MLPHPNAQSNAQCSTPPVLISPVESTPPVPHVSAPLTIAVAKAALGVKRIKIEQ